jgi:EAL domain-containing protein (putative c-di-GMP-specific phosphodiesterase class I)
VRRGLENGEFRLVFQPVVDARTGRAVGAEALVRWAHPERGLLSPGEFLPQIEHTTTSTRLGAWVLRNAVARLADWMRRGLGLWLSVNVDGHELEGHGFASRLREILREHPDCDPSRLKIEIVESTVINDFDKVGRLIGELGELGVRFVLDDFGTGYASIAYLRRLHIQAIKIDRGFVAAMADPGERALVGSLIQIASTLFLECVAEGVETAEQHATLLDMGCRFLQGYHLARPMSANEFLDWLADGPRPRRALLNDAPV